MLGLIYIYIYIGIAIFLASLLALSFVFNSTYATNSANIEASVTIKPSLTLSIPSNTITMNLDPSTHAFDEKDLTVSVGTNNSHGYQLTVSTEGDNTSLKNVADSSKTIPNITASTSAADFPANKWGYRISSGSTSSGNYGQFTSGSVVSESTGPVNRITKTLGFGAKVDYTKESGLYNLNLEFKALPIVTQYYMQDFATDSTLGQRVCTENPTIVIDKRDNQTYTISRLKDGKCWMTQNLRLGKYSNSITLTTADSDVGSGGFTLNGKTTINDGFKSATADNSVYMCKGSYDCYYNWYTATAGYGTLSLVSTTVNYSICPVGWTLPTGGSSGQTTALVNAYGGAGAAAATAMLVDPVTDTENINGHSTPGFTLGGRVITGYDTNEGTWGHYWSRTATSNTTYSYSLGIWPDHIDTTNDMVIKYAGRSVRCILRES